LGHSPSSKPATINRTGYYKPNPLNTNYETAPDTTNKYEPMRTSI
jgi:hypothetical protein